MTPFLLRMSSATMLLLTMIVSGAIAKSDIRTEFIHFRPGAISTVIEGSIKGSEIIDYVINGRNGQYINVSMVTDNDANYFNILAPGENEAAFFNGSTGDNQYEGVLTKKGEYKIRVYQMRNVAHSNEVANYNIEIIITSTGDTKETSQSRPSDDGSASHGTKNKVSSRINCSVGKKQTQDTCLFKVTREGKGNGIVTITKPDESTRTIFFENGKAVGADVSQADPAEFVAEKKGHLNIIRVGDEHYEIPDAVISKD